MDRSRISRLCSKRTRPWMRSTLHSRKRHRTRVIKTYSSTAKAAAKDQIDRASTSLPLNIADGNSKLSTTDGARFLEIARGSALECAACLGVLAARKFVSPDRITPAKEQLVRIVNRLTGMLKKFSSRA